jgi:hypothetical protein
LFDSINIHPSTALLNRSRIPGISPEIIGLLTIAATKHVLPTFLQIRSNSA